MIRKRKALGDISNDENIKTITDNKQKEKEKHKYTLRPRKNTNYNEITEMDVEIQDQNITDKNCKTPMDIEIEEKIVIENSPGVDVKNKDNEFECCEYIKEIYTHMKQNEGKHAILPNYLSFHKVLTTTIRNIIVEWIIDVHNSFKLKQETLHLTIYIMDKFFSMVEISKTKFQLVAITSFYIASKYEEIYGPSIGECAKVTADTYTEKNIIQMEYIILETLKFNITVPSIHFFLERYLQVTESDKKVQFLTEMIVDVCLLDSDYLNFKSSLLATSALFVSRKLFEFEKSFSEELEYYSEYKLEEIKESSLWIVSVLKKFNFFLENDQETYIKAESVKKKYSSKSKMEIIVYFFQMMKRI
jgi:hypothetical protein